MAKKVKQTALPKLSMRERQLLARMVRKHGRDAVIAALQVIEPTRKPGRPKDADWHPREATLPKEEELLMAPFFFVQGRWRELYELKFRPAARSEEHFRTWRRNQAKKLLKLKRLQLERPRRKNPRRSYDIDSRGFEILTESL